MGFFVKAACGFSPALQHFPGAVASFQFFKRGAHLSLECIKGGKVVVAHRAEVTVTVSNNFAIPFFLPNMHERYFYIGEIAVLLYSIVNPKRFWISLLVIMPALATYTGYLWGSNPFSLVTLSLVMLAGIIVISKWLVESILCDQKNSLLL